MFCTQCGHQIPDGFFFCTNCGTRVGGATAQVPNEAVAPFDPIGEQSAASFEPIAATVRNAAPFEETVAQSVPQQASTAAQAAIAQPAPAHAATSPEPPQAYVADSAAWPEWNAAPAQAQQGQGSPAAPQYAQVAPAIAEPNPQAPMQPETDLHYQNYAQQVQGETPVKEFKMPPKKSKAPVIGAIVAILAIAGVLVAGFMTNWFGLAPASSGESSSASSASSFSPVVTVQKSVNDYSWDDLSKISAEISKAESLDAALEVAKNYNLTTSDGKLDGKQTKDVTLADGTKLQAMIVGFYHDDKADGSGKAGISFLFTSAVDQRAFNADATNSGGWKSSAIRKWLSETFAKSLPSDLQSSIVTVNKMTNNVGQTQDEKSVTATTDAIWLPALAEIVARRNASDYKEGQGYRAAVYNAEGTRYKLFSDTKDSSADILTLKLTSNGKTSTCNWWNRTPLPGNKTQFIITSDKGKAGYVSEANAKCGVVPGFCI